MKFLCRFLRHGRISRPCQSAGAQRRGICHFIAAGEPFKISLQHGAVSHHMMGEEHGLRSLHMSIAGQDDILVFSDTPISASSAAISFSASFAICRRIYIWRSAAHWSFLLLAVWSLAPASPISSVRRFPHSYGHLPVPQKMQTGLRLFLFLFSKGPR